MRDNTVSTLDGSTFLVSNPNGDIDASPDQPEGLFFKDTRHLSKWTLTLNGIALDVLSTDTIEYYYAQHFCIPPTGTIYRNPVVSVVRRRFVGSGNQLVTEPAEIDRIIGGIPRRLGVHCFSKQAAVIGRVGIKDIMVHRLTIQVSPAVSFAPPIRPITLNSDSIRHGRIRAASGTRIPTSLFFVRRKSHTTRLHARRQVE